MTQDIIDGKLEKRRRGVYGPPVGKKCVAFLDDLNMPMVEKYGAQPPIELLRQFMDHAGWYDRTELSFRKLVDLHFMAAMGPPGGGRNPVTNRYLRHFNVLYMTEFDDNTKKQIFSAIVDWWFTRSKYKEEIVSLQSRLVAASLDIYTTLIAELLPTPAKIHYTFNLRDLSKVFQGMHTYVGAMEDPDQLVRLWLHEVLRVFHDRLIDDTDREWIVKQLADKTEQHFRVKMTRALSRLADENGHLGASQMRSLLFADFLGGAAAPPKYEEVTDFKKLTHVVTEYLTDFNSASKKPMQLVLFSFALEHVARIARIIRQPGSHALLVGVGGSGRQSLTRLAAFIADYQLFQIEVSSTYTRADWLGDLKAAMRMAGEKHKPCIFLFSDSQIVDEAMTEDLSNLLNTGEVPNIFDAGEIIGIGESVRNKAKQLRMDGSRTDLYNYFIMQVRRNLHVVLCFSPVGDAFRERLRRFPSLITATTIDWFTVWPDDALQSVADQALVDLPLEPLLKTALSEQCMQFHATTRKLSERYRQVARRYFYVTPTSYLQLLDSFKLLLTRKQSEVKTAQKRYEVGLSKLASTEQQVSGMQEELEALKPRLIVSSQETEKLLQVIQLETAEADKVKKVVQADEAQAKEEADKVQAIKDECEAELAEALPAYNAAIKALDTLTKGDISEIKGMKNPPVAVKIVTEAVCILKGLKPVKVKDTNSGQFVMDYWETSKKMMSDMTFLESLKSYDKDNIALEIIEQLKPILNNPDFQPAKIKKVSQAASGLCSWVRAMDTYNRVAKVVGPKKEALAAAEAELASVMKNLAVKQAELAKVEARLQELAAQLHEATTRKEQLQADVSMCEQKLDRAHKLIGGLGGEKARWTQAAQDLGNLYNCLAGDMLLSAGIISYLGACTSDYRTSQLTLWIEQCSAKSIPCSSNFSLISALGQPIIMRRWHIWGLPKDDFSTSNAIIVSESKAWSLCIDPQGQAHKWICNMEKDSGLIITRPSDNNYLRVLENAISLGQPVLLEGVTNRLDASLEPVLLKQTFKQGGVMCIKLGESVVGWSDGFRLYMTTKLRNPHYPPEVCTRVCLLNFAITPAGLDEQLLGITVARERPDLEKDKNELIVQGAENQRQLKEIEDRILQVLSSSEGNILEDGAAVGVLQDAKRLADDIAKKQKDAEKTEAAIDTARIAYQPIAKHAATLFFCVAELGNIDPMYQYSLNFFISLFVRSIEDSTKHPQVSRRLANLKEHFTFFLYTSICRSLFEKDKLLFAFSLANAIKAASGHLDLQQLRFLLTGGVSMNNTHSNPAPNWLSDKSWSDICCLTELAPVFASLRGSFQSAPQRWRNVYDSPKPHTESFPDELSSKLDKFQQILVLRCIALDKLMLAVQDYVMDTMGSRYVEPQSFVLGSIFQDSLSTQPLIFVLSQGSDPMADVLKFADEKHRQVEAVSLGQGQGPIAEKAIEDARKGGYWVVLQNCHLAKSFLPRLESICINSLVPDKTHPEFRLWLTSYPSDIFPVSILENGLKITYELPKGLRAGLQRVYRSDPVCEKGFLEGCRAEQQFRCLAYSLAFFHCVVTGRRAYGPVGWNIPYAFNENDLRISMRQLRMFLDQYEDMPLKMLQYTCGECNYGGKVTDGHDRRTLMTLLEHFYCIPATISGHLLTPSGSYTIPSDGGLENYLEYIHTLPLTEEPEVFGLHANATITKDLQEVNLMLDSLLSTMSSSATTSNTGRSAEEMLAATASEILAKLPEDFNVPEAQRRYPITYLDSTNTVLCQELQRANALLQVIRKSLLELQKAIKGLVVMSSELEKVGIALQNGKVPDMWLSKSFPSLKPLGPYVKEVIERAEFFANWIEHGPPLVFWISGFFFTQAFLTAVKQNFARKYKIPIDLIDFDFFVKDLDDDCEEPPTDGAYVHGMYIEAAGWDYTSHLLCESRPKVLFVKMPNMHFLPGKIEDFVEVSNYNSPLYKTSERRGTLSTTGHSTNFVMDVRLPSDLPPSHWIKRGVAMLTTLDT